MAKKFEMEDDAFNETSLTGDFNEYFEDNEEVIDAEAIHEETENEATPTIDDFEEIEEEKVIEKSKPKKPKTKNRKTKKEGGGKGKSILIFSIFGLAIVGFVGWMFLSVYMDMKKESVDYDTSTASVKYADAPSYSETKDSTSYEATQNTQTALAQEYGVNQTQEEPQNAYGVPVESRQSQEGDWDTATAKAEMESNNEYKEDFYGEEKDSAHVSSVEAEMMGTATEDGAFESNNGGVCDLSTRFTPNVEYIYYVLEGETYIPVFKKKDWNGEGIVVDTRVVTLSYDNINKFTEIEKGKFIPSEMFSKCSAFKNN